MTGPTTAPRDLADALEDSPVFAGMHADHRALLAGCAQIVGFDAAESMLRAGDPADRFWLIRHGRIDIEIHGAAFGTRTIARLEPGEVLGVSWIAAPFTAAFDATAVEAGSAIVFDAACLREKCDRDPALGHDLYRRFAALMRGRLQATRLQLLDLYGGPDAH